MTPGIRPLVAGNWKMNGVGETLGELTEMAEGLAREIEDKVDALICVPATLVSRAADKVSGRGLEIGGEDCHASASGAHTGDISAEMLADAGASFIIVGHSERRSDHAETNEDVKKKTEAVWRAGLVAILCIGETQEEREAGKTLEVLSSQLKGSVPENSTAQGLVIAYEPVWAIGTGLTPTTEDVAQAHAHIRQELGNLIGAEAAQVRILYGGSVKPGNAGELMAIPNVDGALIGGASLKASDFLAIAGVYRELT